MEAEGGAEAEGDDGSRGGGRNSKLRALILCPTRELAMQVSTHPAP